MSGATVMLAEDKPEVMEKVIRISGTPEQADKAQSLLQGFILSSEYISLTDTRFFVHLSAIYNSLPPFLFSVQDDIPSV